jgi:hypothetical protein
VLEGASAEVVAGITSLEVVGGTSAVVEVLVVEAVDSSAGGRVEEVVIACSITEDDVGGSRVEVVVVGSAGDVEISERTAEL